MLCVHGVTVQDSLKILEAVNTFYSQSFNQLITITVAVLAFAGIVLPILITIYQKRLFSLEHKAIEKSIHEKLKNELDSTVVKIKEEYQQKEIEYEEKMAEMKNIMSKELAKAEGGIFHVQGNNELRSELHVIALESFLSSADKYMESEDNLNLRRVIGQCVENCFPNIMGNELKNNEELIKSIDDTIEKLREYNDNGNYSDLIRIIKEEYQLAKNRKPTALKEA